MNRNLSKLSGALLSGALLLVGGLAEAKKPKVGLIKEFATKSTDSDPEGITIGALGIVWYTEQTTNAIVASTTSGKIQVEYAIPTANAGPVGIVQASDLSIWFTETGAGNIGRLDIFGNFNEYAVPNAVNNQLTVLALGSDGNLWFPEEFGNNIDVMDTKGNLLAQYAIPTAGQLPFNIIAGPDGNLWYAGDGVNVSGNFNLSKITTAGVITEYDIGQFDANFLAAGPDGNIWFTDHANQAVGVFNLTTLTATEYPVSGANPEGIVAGADGNLWFAEADGNNIGRITTAGVVTEYAVPTAGSNPTFIAAPGSACESQEPYVYVTETLGGQIAQIYTSDVDKKGGEK